MTYPISTAGGVGLNEQFSPVASCHQRASLSPLPLLRTPVCSRHASGMDEWIALEEREGERERLVAEVGRDIRHLYTQ